MGNLGGSTSILIQDLNSHPEILPPHIKKLRGRPKTKRLCKKSWNQKSSRICGIKGHSWRSCQNQPMASGRAERVQDQAGSESSYAGLSEGDKDIQSSSQILGVTTRKSHGPRW